MAKVEGSELLDLPRDEVWRLLNDPDSLGESIPGCRGFERDGESEHRYRTAITVAVGAVRGVYEGTVEYLDVQEPDRCTIVVSGRGDKGAIDGRGQITLEPRERQTEVGYSGDFKLTGPVAGVGQRLAPGISRKMIVETLRNLEQRGAAPATGESAAPLAAESAGRSTPDFPPVHPPAEPPSAPAESFRPFSVSPALAVALALGVGLLIGILLRVSHNAKTRFGE
jgi:carbon monoxide dehydrogenase subunit G